MTTLAHDSALRSVALLWLATFLCSAGAATWFVAPSGNDGNPGTRSRPFATLERAVQVSRQERGNNRQITVAAGTYYNSHLELGPSDSDLTIVGDMVTEPVLIGGRVLTGFKPEGDRLWTATLPQGVSADFRLLVVNERLAPRARFPESGSLKHLSEFKVPWMGTYGGGWKRKPTHEELTTVLVKQADIGTHFDPVSAELTIYHEWDESMVGVNSFDAVTGRITLSSAAGHPPGAFGNQQFVIWNTRDGLTNPGQWCVDRAQRKVVYWPLPGEKPEQLRAVFPTTPTILTIAGTADHAVTNLTIRGLSFRVTNTPLKAGGFGAYEFSGALNGSFLENCTFARLCVSQVAGQGLKLSRAKQCEIAFCTIQETGAGGILARGSQLVLDSNLVGEVGRIYPSGIGLTCSGNDNSVRGNSIHDTPYVGLTCSGMGARIESNRLERVMQELHDGAGIYLGGTNHLIRGNFCRDIGNSPTERRHGYYMDEHVRGSRLEGNLAMNCPSPLHNHMATNNTIVNNIFIHDGDVRLAFYRCAEHSLDRNLIWAKGKIEVFRPEAVSTWSNNLFYSRSGLVLGYPVNNYAAGEPKPLDRLGVSLGPDPQLTVLKDGKVSWPAGAPESALGILPLDVSSAGAHAGK